MKESAFLKQKFPSLPKEKGVERAIENYTVETGKGVGSVEQGIELYLERFKSLVIDPEDERVRKRNLELIRSKLFNTVVIKPDDIQESYFDLQRKIAEEQGRGGEFPQQISHQMRERAFSNIAADQRSTLNLWINYFASNNSDHLPLWVKYWAFRSVTQLSSYDKESKSFGKRTSSTTAPFADLNQEALATVAGWITTRKSPEYISLSATVRQLENRANKLARSDNNPEELETVRKELAEKNLAFERVKIKNPVEVATNPHAQEVKALSDDEFEKIMSTEDFAKYYSFAIEYVTVDQEKLLETIEGQWVVYPKGSDHMPLVTSLQGHGTGWCTAGESTAESQLRVGDFHVYYSNNDLGVPAIPRVAIRMEHERIAEVRGIAHNQNLDQYIAPVVADKMNEFGNQGKEYIQKAKDMKLVSSIYQKVVGVTEFTDIHGQQRKSEYTKTWLRNNLSVAELRFVYEVDRPVRGFGQVWGAGGDRDPRLDTIRGIRTHQEYDVYSETYFDIYEPIVVNDNIVDLIKIIDQDENKFAAIKAVFSVAKKFNFVEELLVALRDKELLRDTDFIAHELSLSDDRVTTIWPGKDIRYFELVPSFLDHYLERYGVESILRQQIAVELIEACEIDYLDGIERILDAVVDTDLYDKHFSDIKWLIDSFSKYVGESIRMHLSNYAARKGLHKDYFNPLTDIRT
jgi:hypothetical protein